MFVVLTGALLPAMLGQAQEPLSRTFLLPSPDKILRDILFFTLCRDLSSPPTAGSIRVHWAPWEAVKACQHVLPSLQEKAEEVYRVYQNSPLSSHPVVALSELSTLCAGCCPDERTFYLVLLQLQKEKRVTVLEQNGEKVWRVIRSVIDSLMAY